MIWFIIIAVVVIVFYAILSSGTSIKSVEDENDNDEQEVIPNWQKETEKSAVFKKISKTADFCFFIAYSENNHAEPVVVDSYGLPF